MSIVGGIAVALCWVAVLACWLIRQGAAEDRELHALAMRGRLRGSRRGAASEPDLAQAARDRGAV